MTLELDLSRADLAEDFAPPALAAWIADQERRVADAMAARDLCPECGLASPCGKCRPVLRLVKEGD